jgi:hypothetical protein
MVHLAGIACGGLSSGWMINPALAGLIQANKENKIFLVLNGRCTRKAVLDSLTGNGMPGGKPVLPKKIRFWILCPE